MATVENDGLAVEISITLHSIRSALGEATYDIVPLDFGQVAQQLAYSAVGNAVNKSLRRIFSLVIGTESLNLAGLGGPAFGCLNLTSMS